MVERSRLGTTLSLIVAVAAAITLTPAAGPRPRPEPDQGLGVDVRRLGPRRQVDRWSCGPLDSIGTVQPARPGDLRCAHVAAENGRYYLTMTRVDGQKVVGTVEFVGKRTTEFPINGSLSGNRLTYLRTELMISGNRMTGSGPDFKLTLTKDK